ncbi:MAG: glycosyltransferase family 4 protein [Anaerolineales bacterium]|nr:glycosyltransferase family 4 protein [Anaerolineales bacterium]NUQ83431.1 glycosyltransferase family 4 protein [Anaerolineales bacterium]
MKIALLHYSSPPIVGGVESVLAHHASLMTKAGHEVTILAGRGEVFDERIGIRILPRCDSRHPDVLEVKGFLDAGKRTPIFEELRESIKRDLLEALAGYDVLIAHNVASLHKNLALTAALHEIYQTPRFPRLILWHHDLAWTTPRYRHELHEGYPWDLLRTQWEGVTQVVVSELRRRELSELLGITNSSIRVIPNGVDIEAFFKLEPQTVEFMERLNLLEAEPLLLLPVRLTPRKNIELALRVLAELRRELPRAMLLVTGPEGPHNPANQAYKKKLFALRDELQLQGAAHFLAEVTAEFMPDAVIADFYRLADALFFPSQEEGFGIPIIEAAFSKMPVFCADIPVLRELGGEDVTYFAPEADPPGVARQVKVRLEAEFTSRWARRAKRGYAWEQIYVRHIAPLLEEVNQ